MKDTAFYLASCLFFLGLLCSSCNSIPDDPPNILWIVSEDNSPFFGCYGDSLATTPNLDALAARGYMYTHAFANAPVCAPARNTIITGVYANSNGNQHMRSYYPKSEDVRFYPKYLREAGYYCTNCSKEDYNTTDTEGIWDESSPKAHYRNREEGQPFFHIYNSAITHESSLHKTIPEAELVHKPEDMILPPYHPDTKAIRHDWAQYYDKITSLDTLLGKYLAELEAEGLAENTIIFYYGDHGGVLARSKRYVYESGTRVPFIVYIPEKYKHLRPGKPGKAEDRLISFVDLAPTMLSICGLDIPEYLQGSAFLGRKKTREPEYAYMLRGRMDERYDMCRAVRDEKFRYIRNYMPYRVYGQKLEYLWRAPSIRSWEEAYLNNHCNDVQSIFWNAKPAEELYDTENDPWEVNNLADDPKYREVLVRMRKANLEHLREIKDCGFIPEAELIKQRGDMPAYDYVRSGQVDINSIIDAAELASMANKEDIPEILRLLKNSDASIRYWAATGLLIIDSDAASVKEDLQKTLNDPSMSVRVVVAESLYKLGETDKAISALTDVILNGDEFVVTHALNVVDCNDIDTKEIRDAVKNLLARFESPDYKKYDIRMAMGLLEKWEEER